MANPSRIEGDVFISGNLMCGSATLPAGSVGNSAVASGAGVDANKLQHIHKKTVAQPDTTATTETKAIHIVRGLTGTLTDFRAGSIGVCVGAATITVDLKKNGASVLSAVITLNSSNSARVAVAGSISSASVIANDMLEVVITATVGGGTLGTGFFCELTLKEDAQ